MNPLGSLIQRIGIGSPTQAARLKLLIDMVRTAVQDPSHNAVTALLVLAVGGVLLLLLVTMGFLVVTLVQDWRNPPPAPVKRVRQPERVPGIRAAIWTAVVLVVLIAAGVGYGYAMSDATCARCHFTRHAFVSHATDSHAKVACSRCHVAPGPAGAFAALASGASSLRMQLFDPPEDNARVDAPVENAACLSCHGGIATGVVVAGGTRMRHSDVIAVGYQCTDCHSTAGHGQQAVRVRYPTMGQCVQCHDGTKAPSACSTCHSRDVGAPSAARASAGDIPKATITPDGCRGCHAMTTCINCHGIELPHSDQFIAGYHARKALLEPQVCIKCHSVTDFCNGCHQFRTTSNGLPLAPHGNNASDFITWHKQAGSPTSNGDSASCSCHTHGDSARRPLCDDCHAKQPSR